MKLSCIAIVVGAVALTLSSCSEKKTAAKAQVSYPTQVIDLADRTLKSDFAASVTGCQTVEVRPQIDGMLTRICIREGDPVRKGQVLFEIDPAQFQAAYDIAAAEKSLRLYNMITGIQYGEIEDPFGWTVFVD